ncbi:hypothetical protein [Neobacillus sp. Marseille-QA0830]
MGRAIVLKAAFTFKIKENISGAGGSFNQFVKNNDGTIVITYFDGKVGYPDHPIEGDTVRNSDDKVIKTEDLFQQSLGNINLYFN